MLLGISRNLPLPVDIWRGWCLACGILGLAGVAALAFLEITDSRSDRIWSVGEFRLETPAPRFASEIRYRLTATPSMSCPGVVSFTFVGDGAGHDRGAEPVVMIQRPLLRPGVPIRDAQFSVELPQIITSGDWRVTMSVTSSCPLRTVTDQLAEFVLRVRP